MVSWNNLGICSSFLVLRKLHRIHYGTLTVACVLVTLYFLKQWPVPQWAARDHDDLSITWDHFTANETLSALFSITSHFKIEPILMQPEILKLKEGEKLRSKDINLMGVLETQVGQIQTLLNKEFVLFNVTEITRQLPVDLTTDRRRQTTCFILRRGSIVFVRLIVVYFRDNFVYFPSCLNSEKPQPFASPVFGDTPMVFDRFQLEKVNMGGINVFLPKDVTRFLMQYPNSQYIECRRDLAPKFKKYNEPDGMVKNMLPTLVYFKNQLQKLGKLPFIMAGTLLGWYRQCHFILNTGDVDVALYSSDLDAALHDYIRTNPKITGHHFNLPEDGYQYYLYVNMVRLDLFFLYDTNQTDIVYMGSWDSPRQRLRSFYPRSEVCSGVLLGHRFNVPCRVEAVIETEYGKRWTILSTHQGSEWPANMKKLPPWSDELWKRARMDIKDPKNVIRT